MTNIEITGSEATEIQGEDLDKVVGGRSSFAKIRRKKRKGKRLTQEEKNMLIRRDLQKMIKKDYPLGVPGDD